MTSTVTDLPRLRAAVVDALRGRGWGEKIGKERGGSQALLEHSMAVFDVLAACLPRFGAACRPALTADEVETILVATVVHDAGKASDSWQAYVTGAGDFAPHVLESEIRALAVGLCADVGLDLGAQIEDVVSCALLHDREERRTRGEFREWSRPTASPRVRKLADLVNHADTLASVSDLMAASRFLADHPLLLGESSSTSYSVRVRGVSTTYLHAAAREAFEAAGWEALLFFENGTLFVGDGKPVSMTDVETRVASALTALLERRSEQLSELAVGKPLGNFLPRPELVRPTTPALQGLWAVAKTRVRYKAKVSAEDLAKWNAQWADQVNRHAGEPGPKTTPTNAQPTSAQIQALLDVGPEACVFKLAKNLFEKVLCEARQPEAQRLWEETFGPNTFAPMMSQATYMPVQDYFRCVYPWHQLPATLVGGEPGLLVGDVARETRVAWLAKKLPQIAVDAIADSDVPWKGLGQSWVHQMLGDLRLTTGEVASNSDSQLAGYASLKAKRPTSTCAGARWSSQLAGYASLKAKGANRAESQCVQCADPIQAGGATVQSDSLGNAGSYSNRRLAFTSSGSPPICPACEMDTKLTQLALGGTPVTAIAFVPRRSLPPEAARSLVATLISLRDTLDRQLHPATMRPDQYLALSFPVDLIRTAGGDTAAADLVRPASKETVKERTAKLKKDLDERIGEEGLADLCKETGAVFSSIEELAQALMSGAAPTHVRDDADVRAAVSRMNGGSIDFSMVTPNLAVISMDRAIGTKDHSASDVALLSFSLAALLARHAQGAVAIGPVREIRAALATRAGRTVYVPSNGPARLILGGDWLPLHEARRRLRGIQAALALTGDLNARSILEVLKYPSKGFVVRRIEMQAPAGKPRPPPYWDSRWHHIEALGEVIGT